MLFTHVTAGCVTSIYLNKQYLISLSWIVQSSSSDQTLVCSLSQAIINTSVLKVSTHDSKIICKIVWKPTLQKSKQKFYSYDIKSCCHPLFSLFSACWGTEYRRTLVRYSQELEVLTKDKGLDGMHGWTLFYSRRDQMTSHCLALLYISTCREME